MFSDCVAETCFTLAVVDDECFAGLLAMGGFALPAVVGLAGGRGLELTAAVLWSLLAPGDVFVGC